MSDALAAQLLLLRKRTATWILLGFWMLVTVTFAYVLPYFAYKGDIRLREHGGPVLLNALLPHNLVLSLLTGFPAYGGLFVLILAVLAMGSEYTWGTLTPAFTQRASRLKVFFSKILALAIALTPFVILVYLLGFIASMLIALREGQSTQLPNLWLLARALAFSWFILAVWACFGVMIAVLSKGTSLAIGLGIIYGLVLESVISAFASQITLLDYMSKAFLRTNGYSLIAPLGSVAPGGPGGFAGSTVSAPQAAIVLAVEIVAFLAAAAYIVRRRDVAGAS